jgi:hypothetical protein
VPNRRSWPTDSRRAAKQLCCRLAQCDQDSSVTELSAAEQTQIESLYGGRNVVTTMSVADEITDLQSLEEGVDDTTTEQCCPDMKVNFLSAM